MSDPAQNRPGAVWTLALLLAINTLCYADRHLFAILIPQIKLEFGASDALLGLLSGPAFVIPYILFSLPIARLGDRWSKRGVVALSATVWGAASAVSGMANQFGQLALARIVIGTGEAGSMPSSQAIVAGLFPPQRRSLAIGLLSSTTYLGLIVGLTGGGLVAQVWGWRAAFLALSAPVAIMALLLWLTGTRTGHPSDDATGAPQASETLGQTIRAFYANPGLRLLALGIGVFHVFAYAATTWLPAYFVRSQGMTVLEAAAWLGIGGAAGGAIGSLGGGLLADRLSRHGAHWRLRVPAIGQFLALPACMAMLLAPAGATVQIPGFAVPLIAAPLLAFTVLSALWAAPAYRAVSEAVPESRRAQAISLLIVSINLVGSVVGPPAAGLVSDLLEMVYGDEALRYSLMALAGLTIVGGAITWRSAGALGGVQAEVSRT